ncbi:MAG: hypothetical protein HFJ26_01735 [Clostridia bacterium]|nr:hypothetical protein [Clostridia bacterium]
MLKAIKDFGNEANRIIKKETRKINNLHKEIEDYETLIYVVGQTGGQEQVLYYREKINQCYSRIDACIDNINNSKERIATMRVVDEIIKRGEKCA